MPSGSHPLGFGAVQSSSTRVSSPLATSFGFGSTAGPSTPTTTNPYPYQWASPHHHQNQPTASPHHVVVPNPNPFAHAWARTGSSASTSINRPEATSQSYDGAHASGHAKRRRSGSEDSVMERRSVSPTPGGRTMKRLRQGREAQGPASREEAGEGEPEADLGVLLASLPSSTHLQILHALIASHPALKPTIHALIPPPEVSFAIQVLDEKVQRLTEAVPIGAQAHEEQRRPAGASFGFGSSSRATTTTTSRTVSDGYILNRLRLPMTEFTNVATTYLPYFIWRTTDKPGQTPPHPSTSFQYLSHLTTLIITRIFPIIPQSALHTPDALPQLTTLLRALTAAWQSWLRQISEHVNARAGMYAASMAQGWISGIEGMASQAERFAHNPSKNREASRNGTGTGADDGPADMLAREMRALAREWVGSVGWLIGRSVPSVEMSDRMDE